MEKNIGSECEEPGGAAAGKRMGEQVRRRQTGAQVTEVSVPSHNKWSVIRDSRDIATRIVRGVMTICKVGEAEMMQFMINWV